MVETKKEIFQEGWLERIDETGEMFKIWLLPNTNKTSEVFCAICSWKKICIKRGFQSIVQHSKTKRHKNLMEILRRKREQELKVRQ